MNTLKYESETRRLKACSDPLSVYCMGCQSTGVGICSAFFIRE